MFKGKTETEDKPENTELQTKIEIKSEPKLKIGIEDGNNTALETATKNEPIKIEAENGTKSNELRTEIETENVPNVESKIKNESQTEPETNTKIGPKPAVPVEKDGLPVYQKESVLLIKETITAGERIYANKMYDAFAPYRLFWIPFVRFPLVWDKFSDGSFEFRFTAKSLLGIGFFLTGFLLILVFIVTVVGLVSILVNLPQQPEITLYNHKTKMRTELRIEELYILQRNFAPVIIVLCSLMHTVVGDWNFFNKKMFVGHYFTFWTEAVEIMRLDVTVGVRKFMLKILLFYSFFMLLLLLLCGLRFAPISTGGPVLFVMLWARVVKPEVHLFKHFFIIRVVGSCVFFYVIIVSKVYVFLFLYKCKILKNAFKEWNIRLEKVLHKGEGGKTRLEKSMGRTGFDHLFKDHVILLDLIDGADTLFSNIIESYYAANIVSVCFEVFYLYSCVTDAKQFKHARRLDAIVMAVYLFHTVILFFLVSAAAADVGDEAMNGLEIIRRKGLIGKKTEEEIFFMLSMYISYSGHFETALAGGRYFVMDTGFFVGILGTIFSYFIVVIQFSPPLSMKDKKRLEYINSTELLLNTENTINYFDQLPIGYLFVDKLNEDWNLTQNWGPLID